MTHSTTPQFKGIRNPCSRGFEIPNLPDILRKYARQYETEAFLTADPSFFMHQVKGSAHKEAIAFIASCLSYGSRAQFMPKIQQLLDWSGGQPHRWLLDGDYRPHFSLADHSSFYRLTSFADMRRFLDAYRQLLSVHGSLGAYVRSNAATGLDAVKAITAYFAAHGTSSSLVPKDAQSACKRVCMFLRWMVRNPSPVDLGLWSTFIDRRTLIMPLDTHVLTEAVKLGLLSAKTSSMATAIKLTDKMATVFPDDPLLGDFALFGYGVDINNQEHNQYGPKRTQTKG